MKFIYVFLILGFLGAKSADACTVRPVSAIAQKNDLAAEALTRVGVSIENVTSIEVEDYSGDYIWTPMCPKGLWSEAKFTISFNDLSDPLSKGCTTIIKVSKKLTYDEGGPKYSFDEIQPASCLE